MGALALGTAALSLLGAVGAALSLGTRRGSVLLSLMMLPMAMPVLIFGARATDLAMSQGVPDAGLWLLAALLIAAISLVPVALAAAVRISFE
jgi:heme exporter protein B